MYIYGKYELYEILIYWLSFQNLIRLSSISCHTKGIVPIKLFTSSQFALELISRTLQSQWPFIPQVKETRHVKTVHCQQTESKITHFILLFVVRKLNVKLTQSEMEKSVRVTLPSNKFENVLHIELISQSDRLVIGPRNKAIIIIDRNRSMLLPVQLYKGVIQSIIHKQICLLYTYTIHYCQTP